MAQSSKHAIHSHSTLIRAKSLIPRPCIPTYALHNKSADYLLGTSRDYRCARDHLGIHQSAAFAPDDRSRPTPVDVGGTKTHTSVYLSSIPQHPERRFKRGPPNVSTKMPVPLPPQDLLIGHVHGHKRRIYIRPGCRALQRDWNTLVLGI